ncbi:hypothetical protein B0T24DRAFT_74205 [Lasiosphaeria ovina]|uniref:Uncharacterized protein n=1 Tax=Lasiosphaeria ovina TaxID=92902 RepID=A0AAE0TYK9_9PEZI|nr:hypothetical protein B0T24DRAFT_74205 [Lasiosphaeria ovina]
MGAFHADFLASITISAERATPKLAVLSDRGRLALACIRVCACTVPRRWLSLAGLAPIMFPVSRRFGPRPASFLLHLGLDELHSLPRSDVASRHLDRRSAQPSVPHALLALVSSQTWTSSGAGRGALRVSRKSAWAPALASRTRRDRRPVSTREYPGRCPPRPLRDEPALPLRLPCTCRIPHAALELGEACVVGGSSIPLLLRVHP